MTLTASTITGSSSSPRPYATIPVGAATITFHLGDSLDVLRALPPKSIGVVVTSPPYNLGAKYTTYKDNRPQSEYLAWTQQWISATAPVLARQGSFFLNVGAKPTEPWTAHDVVQVARKHFQLQNRIAWVKSVALDTDAAARVGLPVAVGLGHYKPLQSDRFLNQCFEDVFQLTPTGETPLDRLAIGVPYADTSNVARWAAAGRSGGLHCRGNTWFVPYETIQKRETDRPHPATFPERLPELCVRLHGIERCGTVLDPFLGSGTTTVVAARLGLNAIGIEMDEDYLKAAIERTREAIAEPGLFG